MRSAVAFLTVLGRSQAPGATTFPWFPIVGAAIGAIVAAAHWGAHELWPVLVAGLVVVAVDLVVTGALHVDGLADSADGLLPHMDRERRLRVMGEPTVGVFAVVVVVVVLGLRWSVLADADIEPLSLVAVWSLGRTAAAVAPAVVPYARDRGLASPFLDGSSVWIAIAVVPIGAALIVTAGVAGGVALGVGLIAAAGLLVVATRRLGGFTGDVLGAVIVTSETVALLALGAAA